ncbi:hypothetical protein [Methylocystis echinoides]|uniref:Uncharacterized protein n=1 Tax=Methylocystis echinoides TaxID=29468 RepID=A0A9W6GZC0_9HYPH|nr:hypothetical protein [Methylocystis echinoides]GLI95701.1 hypothetical protein LMG27198_46930 [Methylocystis echinoides]
MTAVNLPSSLSRAAIGIVALAVASVLFTLGFACAVPLAAFAAIAAISFDRREALAAIGAVWLANQAWGFTVMHYPMDGETFAWGGALGIIAVLSCEAARAATRRFSGAVGACVSFLAAFVAYEGSLIVINLVTGQSGEDFAPVTVARIFLINACAFGGLWALKAVAANTASGRKLSGTLAPRHI